MSHYARTPVLQIKSTAELVTALQRLFPANVKIEVHPEAQALYGYRGDQRPERAHVIIRRRYVGRASNDIGFFQRPDGRWEALVSEYDKTRYNTAWVQTLVMECGVQRVIQKARRLGHQVVRQTNRKGLPRLVITGRW